MITMEEKICFANRRGRCKILNVNKCEGSSCSFFKTEEQLEKERKKAFEYNLSLDEATRKHIIDTYYGGKMNTLTGKENSL